MTRPRHPLYGLMAEFETPEQVLEAARRARALGFTCMDAYTPFPVEDLADALGRRPARMPLVVLLGGLLGGAGAYFMQWYSATISYPLNVGGRPLHSWPSFVPITFELTVLGAALAAILGMFALNGLPMPYHPVFNVPRFALASRNRFFLCIESVDPRFDEPAVRRFFEDLHPAGIAEVER